MKKAYFSKRIWKDDVNVLTVAEMAMLSQVFNCAKRFAFQTLIRQKRWERELHKESIHLVVKRKFGVNDYIANSIVRESQALLKAQTELNKLYIKQTDEKIKKIKSKLKKERSFLTTLRKIKNSCVEGNLQFPKNRNYALHSSGLISLECKSYSLIWMNTYLFEHQYLDLTIKQLKAKIGRLEHRLFRLEGKKEKLTTHISSVVFGSKKLFKHQFTKKEFVQDHQSWKEHFLAVRNKQVLISGRKDAAAGNFVFTYQPDTNDLHMTSLSGKVVTFSNVVFPYGQEQVNQTVLRQRKCKDKKANGKPISWSIEDHGDYYIIKCLLDVEEEVLVNFSTSGGVIGVDCNMDHFAWTDISKDGNFLESGTFSFTLNKKTNGQSTKILEAEAIALVNVAVQKNKPIVMEDIDTTLSKTGDAYGNKKANRLKSIFAYRKMAQAIKSRAQKMGVAVIVVNPAYTSITGKLKYMRKFGISIHQAASYTIGRKGLGYKEKVPQVLRHHIVRLPLPYWKQWWELNKKLHVRTEMFYQLFDVNKPSSKINLTHKELTEKESKHLKKAFA
ncbi:IS200/IS605 family accessory protein TnpB-related protein [Priestia aryabhattai]|uniref:IS200/IS605 family accessory protein TnpB-related protein n=1 Tax=Priestia TaxID=2800373 RepID=UPI00288209FD|nr:IS200/IS605 family accessory protein TnpB-related protein [Priestia aryabhattai]MDT0148428.1 IS200/IS605 family accessory protein TnpB-related protein [Priestia aryabhattai]MDT0153706.1 IS200/IS605 family accessory protein TnpB-related protein [Priestia aryabhattai]